MFIEKVLQPFLETTKYYADNNAFCIAGKFHSYHEFAKHISKIRKAINSGYTGSKNIGIVANDDIETYASIFACWLEGYAYVPIHPQQPLERSAEIITQADVDLLLDSRLNKVFTSYSVIYSSLLTFQEMKIKPNPITDDALAYILFTSGSTGKPKGVQITRGNVYAFMKSFGEVGLSINQDDRCLQCFDLTFDVSVQSFLVPLTNGACVYTVPHNQIKYSYVYGLLEDHKLTFGAMAPSMIRYFRPYFDEINLPGMRYNILTAEASPLDLIIEWSKCIPNAEIYDFYGPTEATIYCTYNKFLREGHNKHLNGMLSIGKPMSVVKAIIIDNEKRILREYQKGELCVYGPQITPGYWKNEEKNVTSFFEINEGNEIKRFYKTGDSCYFDDQGDIMLAGRLDQQVKIQGYRVELGEIEYNAIKYVPGRSVIAIPFENSTGNQEIALVIEGKEFDISGLFQFLKSKLPPYMIPGKITFLPEFPLNSSSKIDRLRIKSFL
jgi:D-alanine--poly(phosphoribitol) ligase subunit 1